MKLKFYYIDDVFISEMKKIEPKIQDNYNGVRPYIGIVLSINGMNYFAPLSSYKKKQDKIKNISVFKIHEKSNPNNKLGVIHLNNMLPVPNDKLTEVTINTTEKYGILLQNQYEYINHHHKQICKQAQKLYTIVVNGNSIKLNKISCDFKLLEEYLRDIERDREKAVEIEKQPTAKLLNAITELENGETTIYESLDDFFKVFK